MTFKKGHKPFEKKADYFCYTCGETLKKGEEIEGEKEIFCSKKCRRICEK